MPFAISLRSIERESDRMCRVAVPYFLRIRSTAGESEKTEEQKEHIDVVERAALYRRC
nr:hypothetical protein Itr_chr11CG09530 [Ipomoea trifida]